MIQYSRTFAPQVQMPWNQADAPLLLESFPKRPRTRSKASQFTGSHKCKQNKTNKQPSFIDNSTLDANPLLDLYNFFIFSKEPSVPIEGFFLIR
jgi:hypothetical protein